MPVSEADLLRCGVLYIGFFGLMTSFQIFSATMLANAIFDPIVTKYREIPQSLNWWKSLHISKKEIVVLAINFLERNNNFRNKWISDQVKTIAFKITRNFLTRYNKDWGRPVY